MYLLMTFTKRNINFILKQEKSIEQTPAKIKPLNKIKAKLIMAMSFPNGLHRRKTWP
jgi:hypothetical protein